MPVKQGHLPIDHLGRIEARDKKLLVRETSRAIANSKDKIPCPCTICRRQPGSKLSLKTVKKHIGWFKYHDWLRGSSEVTLSIHYLSLLCTIFSLSI
jgi:hypothetical protein